MLRNTLCCLILVTVLSSTAVKHHFSRCVFLLQNKKLSYRRGTARRAVSVETVRNVAQMFMELHLISPATGE